MPVPLSAEDRLAARISHPALSSTIAGTSNVEHLRSYVAIVEKDPLPLDLYGEAKRRLQPGAASAC